MPVAEPPSPTARRRLADPARSLAGVELLIGVMSFRSPVAAGRRHSIRQLMHRSPATAVRFVLADSAPDSDSMADDVLLLAVPESGRTLGTYLLTNAYLRWATKLQPAVKYIGRADDDALFDLPTVLSEVRSVAASGWSSLIYGPFHEWYMWAVDAMLPTCFDFSRTRFLAAVLEGRRRIAAAPAHNRSLARVIPRFQRECLYADAVGPYPFAKGPLVVYSRSVAERLVGLPQFDADEAHALSTRKTSTLRNAVSGRLSPSRSARHPSKSIVFDDIYYGYLVLLAYAREPLALVHARLSEYRKDKYTRINTHGGRPSHTRTRSALLPVHPVFRAPLNSPLGALQAGGCASPTSSRRRSAFPT